MAPCDVEASHAFYGQNTGISPFEAKKAILSQCRQLYCHMLSTGPKQQRHPGCLNEDMGWGRHSFPLYKQQIQHKWL